MNLKNVFALSDAIRYVAVNEEGELRLESRADLPNASSSESDRYEELIVNPTLLTLTRTRGEIDCGGLRCVVVCYGNFDQLVVPLPTGHVSVAFEAGHDPAQFAASVADLAGRD